ncbi:fumarate hydratase class II [Marinobacterium nitratireducens]|uniref:Fumarate hydratase class II n=1 Tax=Marinobacterium nitratireducens TaxID=518897 RepID=A0A918DXM7_9GAMM|nr:class II fumarate hydratase [Marinobacterium nitratireducens]GGO86826.1 fumarate hydratase class II [Marinobacterium nitratireducens]
MSQYRIEQDSMGELRVPADALYGAQTQRAIENFPISGLRMPAPFIRALALIKAAAAECNAELGLLAQDVAGAISQAARGIAAGEHADQFPVDVFQTGSGTSSNMNANEVIASLASALCGQTVNPNDHVNMGQSSNDVIPSALHLSAAMVLDDALLPALHHLQVTIDSRAESLDGLVKTGRTHLMDAMPVRMSQTLSGWSGQIQLAMRRLEDSRDRLHRLAQGGTAVGTGINAHPEFSARMAQKLSELTGLMLLPAANPFTALASQDTAVELSGQLKACACALMKIANDLRWMNSGPLAGLGEIELQALQPGSSIMPGKVNPVIPEAVMMAGAQVIGNDAAITTGGQHGNFELNVMLPMIAHNLLQSESLLATCARQLADKAIQTFRVNEDRLNDALARNPILVTALNPIIGYQKAAAIAKRAYAEGRPVLDIAAEDTDLSRDELSRLLDPARLTEGGIQE